MSTCPVKCRADQAAATISFTGRIVVKRGASGDRSAPRALGDEPQEVAHRGQEHVVAFKDIRLAGAAAGGLERDLGRQEIDLDQAFEPHQPGAADEDGREVIHRHGADRPACRRKHQGGGEIDAGERRMAQAFGPCKRQARKKHHRQIDLVREVKQHPATLGPRGVAVTKAPVRPPLPHVMADLEGEAVDVGEVFGGERLQRRVVAHHEADQAAIRHRGGGGVDRRHLFGRVGQGLFDVKRAGSSARRSRSAPVGSGSRWR
ncbi:hypothetical protein ACTTAL_15255 [Rhodobacter capsulatus]